MSLGEIIDSVNKAIERAAKLTTKQRKKLKSGTFCGPNRSFPVNDCTRVRAAKVYLKRSNFSASVQSKIAACINRKAKALGCQGKTPAKGKGSIDFEYTDLTDKEKKVFDSDIFVTTRELVDRSIESETPMEVDFNDCCK